MKKSISNCFQNDGKDKNLQILQHIDSSLVSSAEKFRAEEGICDLDDLFKGKDTRTHAKHVGVVMLTGERSGLGVSAKTCADTCVLVCRDAHADTCAADEDTECGFTRKARMKPVEGSMAP